MRILLVEDDVMLAEAITRALTQSAHAVDNASTGEERSGPANLNNAISGNSGHNAEPKPVWQ